MVTDPTRAIEWMIGLPTVTFLGGEDGTNGAARIHLETKVSSVGCPRCGVVAHVKDRSRVELVDLPMFGRPVRLVWHKRRWVCADADCAGGSWTEEEHGIASPRQMLTTRAARWATVQVGRCARSVNEVAGELGCDSQTETGAAVWRCSVCGPVGLTRAVIDASAVLCQICRPVPACTRVDRA